MCLLIDTVSQVNDVAHGSLVIGCFSFLKTYIADYFIKFCWLLQVPVALFTKILTLSRKIFS